MKKLLAIVISMAMIVAMMPMGVFADEHNETQLSNVVEVSTAEGLQQAFNSSSTIKLTGNITLNSQLNIDGQDNVFVIDLNGYNINDNTSAGNWIFGFKNGTLTIQGTGQINSNRAAAIELKGSTNAEEKEYTNIRNEKEKEDDK